MTLHRDLVVIASAGGGPEALCKILKTLPADFRAAILIAQHMSPDSPLRLARTLSRCGPLTVEYASGHDELVAGKVYLAPPDLHMFVRSTGLVGLKFESKVHCSRPAADPLFKSAALIYGRRVIGIVLTGGDGDGSAGLRAITTAGGVGIVQDPDEARNPDMPLAALNADSPRYVLPIDEIGGILTRLTVGEVPRFERLNALTERP